MKENLSRSGKADKTDKWYIKQELTEKRDWQLRCRRNKKKLEHLSGDLHKVICKYITTFIKGKDSSSTILFVYLSVVLETASFRDYIICCTNCISLSTYRNISFYLS